jgi:hypothetical protein
MIDKILTNLNFTVDINELREYYNILKEQHCDLNWSWAKCGDDIVEQWRDAAHQDSANLLTHGWAVQSNLKDITIPCPPWNISKHETVEYRNTKLAFGIIKRLQTAIPYGYRWSVSVQPQGGKVSLHSDQEDELTVWIPIYTDGVAITFVTPEKNTGYCLDSNGGAYLLDTTVPHFTYNDSQQDRVTIIFRLNVKHLNELLEVQGLL